RSARRGERRAATAAGLTTSTISSGAHMEAKAFGMRAQGAKRKVRRRMLAAMLALALAPCASAQAPAKDPLPAGQMKIVVRYSPGGGTDILARALAQQLGELLHRTVIVENRVGANGVVGAAYVAKAPPDGLTMLLVPAGYAANPAMYKSLPYDQSKD